MTTNQEHIFALDIGTRTVVGLLCEKTEKGLKLITSQVLEHSERAMLDGQIHRVEGVSNLIAEIKEKMEKSTGKKLNEVAIAAAGRALKTIIEKSKLEFPSKHELTAEDVRSLEYTAVQKAQQKLGQEDAERGPDFYHFVGYSVLERQLDGIQIGDLMGQRGQQAEAKVVATFLPRIVVDSLLTSVHRAGLRVNYMTLEPIAAANIVVPESLHNLNLALIDIGAGTSDIAITEEGKISGYAMVPVAGDEITEKICQHFLFDFPTGERIKKSLQEGKTMEATNMLEQSTELEPEEVLKTIEGEVERLAYLICEQIKRVNQKTPQAVICIGGGSLTPMLPQMLADNLGISLDRVAIRKKAQQNKIQGSIQNLSEAQSMTPLGIAITASEDRTRTHFIDIRVEGEMTHLFTLAEPTVSDALLAAGINIRALRGKPGLALTVKVKGELRSLKGTMGVEGRILLNNSEAGLNSKIETGDDIKIEYGKDGENASGRVADILPELRNTRVSLNGKEVELEPAIFMNKNRVTPTTELIDRASIKFYPCEKIRDILLYHLDIPKQEFVPETISFTLNDEERSVVVNRYRIQLNGLEAGLDDEIDEGDRIIIEKRDKRLPTISDIIWRDIEEFAININLNGNRIKIPPQQWSVTSNQQSTSLQQEISPGDQITCTPMPIRFNEVLSHIDYSIPQGQSGSPILKKNGSKVNFRAEIKDGDSLELVYDSSSSTG